MPECEVVLCLRVAGSEPLGTRSYPKKMDAGDVSQENPCTLQDKRLLGR